jgi:succinoglycan biosynthesis protein ExoM
MVRKKAELGTISSSKIAIGLCTYHRNEFLDGALDSLSRIDLPDGVAVEFVLIDNDYSGGARAVFDTWADAMPFKSHYFVEPNQGLVYARNRVIEEAISLGATEIAFFDDDEIVLSNWLTALWSTYTTLAVAGVRGQVYRLLPIKHDPLLEKFWPNAAAHNFGEGCLILTGNCLFSSNLVESNGLNLRFDQFFNQIGGEDSKFAVDAAVRGAKFAFANEAVAIERFTEERATFSYLLKRYFGGGNLNFFIKCRPGIGVGKCLLLQAISIPWRTAFIPFSLCFGRFQFWHNILKLAASAGMLAGYFGYKYKHYTQAEEHKREK